MNQIRYQSVIRRDRRKAMWRLERYRMRRARLWMLRKIERVK